MPFVTTCPHCKTSFKIAPDLFEHGRRQVRCGVCKRVFAGGDHLRYLAETTGAAQSPATTASLPPAAATGRGGKAAAGEEPAAGGRRLTPGAPLFPAPRAGEWDPLQALAQSSDSGSHDVPAASHDESERGRHPRIDPIPAHQGDAIPGRTGEARAGADERHTIFTQTPANWRESAVLPGHDQKVESRSTRPWHVYLVIALLLVAALQLMLLFRTEIVTRIPALRPVVGVIAGAFGLSVEGVRSLASLTIESTELQRAGGNGQAALHALLRNKDERTVRWPALELTLTDQAGTVVLRKVLLPADYLPAAAPRDGLRGRSEWPLRLGLDLGSLPLADYSLNLFYP